MLNESFISLHESDASFHPEDIPDSADSLDSEADSCTEEDIKEMTPEGGKILLVFWVQLLMLLYRCMTCGVYGTLNQLMYRGTLVVVDGM